MTEGLSSELKNVGHISFFYHIVNCYMLAQSKALHLSVEKVYGAGGLQEVYFMQLLHIYWLNQEALGEDFKETWVRVNTYFSHAFHVRHWNEENEEVNSDIGIFEVQVCGVGTL